MLSQDDYYKVCEKSNITSIDIIVSYEGKYLVGKRINNPAKGFFFVPGGVIGKDETISQAMKRLSKRELSVELNIEDFNFLVISQHWYDCNCIDDKFGTHYISLSYEKELTYDEFIKINLDDQHSESKFMTKEEIFSRSDVHNNTKGFFDSSYFVVK
jgi:colanic acid biosynthesis protein WcaH